MINFKQFTNLTDVVIPNAVQLTNADFSSAFNNMQSLQYVSLPNRATNMYRVFNNCQNLIGESPICSNQVTNMSNAYRYCSNLKGSPVCGENVTNMSSTYNMCVNLTGSPVCGDNVTNMSGTYYYCQNLTGSPVCGNKVTNMSGAYFNCQNLTGSPVCGDNVTNMTGTYFNCRKLTGLPICGDNVTDMSSTYANCINLTGSPVCGENVTNMSHTYENCPNIIGPVVIGEKVTTMNSTFEGCTNLSGNVYICSNSVDSMSRCFMGRNFQSALNIYIPTTLFNTINSAAFSSALTGYMITFANQTEYNRYHNTQYNLDIYPVTNVKNAYIENEYGNNAIPFIKNQYIQNNQNITAFKTEWHYASTELPIDSGSAFVMSVNMNEVGSVTVESMEVK